MSKSLLDSLWKLLTVLIMLCACNFPYGAIPSSDIPSTGVLSLVSTATAERTDPPAIAPTDTSVVVVPTLVPTNPPPVAILPTQTLSPTSIPEPIGCLKPPDDYTRVIINGEQLNVRTVRMLQHAQDLYDGTIDFAGWAVTQGSYNPGGVAASFGTHDGGGAVDIAVINPKTGRVLRDELPAAIQALRVAGFAAWVREVNELYAGSPIHIHAIAIGDTELSQAAKDQLTGHYAYFLGFNGLPKTDNIPVADRHGGPILCQWMRDLGYYDMRH